MNRLIIIGNGFDLAHGLPTRYEDFILHYVENVLDSFLQNRTYEDDLIKLSDINVVINDDFKQRFLNLIRSDKAAFRSFLKNNELVDKNLGYTYRTIADIRLKNNFMDCLLEKYCETWVDIEQFYYDTLIKVAKKEIEPNRREHWYKGDLTDLNLGFKFLKERFEDYLREVVGSVLLKPNEEIIRLWTGNSKVPGVDFEDETNTPLRTPEKLIFLNFNYTNTVSKYIQKIKQSYDFESEPIEIQIHGRVDDKANPIIFGFGDEMDDNYKLLEQRNNNRYLDYMKSFGYFKTNNYRLLHKSINAAPFEVLIMGHSCGLSDRVMLNMIFEHTNCKSIKVFHHQDKNGHNNYLDLTQNISRHFNDKGSQRLKVRSELELAPLPQCGN
jgi:hypothetical protein